MGGLSYLVLRRGTYHFRASVPVDLRPRIGRGELRVSLGTGRLSEARDKAFALAGFTRLLMKQMKAGEMADMTRDELFELTRREFQRILDEDFHARLRDPHSYKYKVAVPESIRDESDKEFLGPGYKYEATWAQKIVDEAVRGKRWAEFKAPVLEMLEYLGVDIAPDSPEFPELCYYYATGLGRLFDIIKVRDSGDIEFIAEPFIEGKAPTDQPAIASPTPSTSPTGHKLSLLIETFIQEKAKADTWNERTRTEYPKKIRMLTDLMGDVELESVGHAFARDYKSKLMDHNGRKAKERSTDTINYYLRAAASLFDYGERHGYVEKNYFKGMLLPKRKSAKDERDAFTADDLALIFGEAYPGDRHKEPWAFWVPVLGLYTGARLEEICQLHIGDVMSSGGIMSININRDGGGKRVKNSSSRRVVPIHPFVADDLQFGGYIEGLRSTGEERVFPSLKRLGFKYGQAVSNWFSRYKTRLGFPDTKAFHSFRHTFTTNLLHRDVPIHVVDWLTGHAIPGETGGRYGKVPKDPAMLMPHLMKLDFGIDLSHLARSRFVEGS